MGGNWSQGIARIPIWQKATWVACLTFITRNCLRELIVERKERYEEIIGDKLELSSPSAIFGKLRLI